jgi:hypothetical protein
MDLGFNSMLKAKFWANPKMGKRRNRRTNLMGFFFLKSIAF